MLTYETSLTYMLGGMQKGKEDYDITHICRWDVDSIPYGGTCTHPAVKEAMRGEFELSPEELELLDKQRVERFKACHNANNKKWHQKMIAGPDRDEYLAAGSARAMKSKANNPERVKETDQKRFEKNLAEKRYVCEPCGAVFQVQRHLDDHLKSEAHKAGSAVGQKAAASAAQRSATMKAVKQDPKKAPFYCRPCDKGFATAHGFRNHTNTSVRHLEKMRASPEAAALKSFIGKT
jgi:hypothetical protein